MCQFNDWLLWSWSPLLGCSSLCVIRGGCPSKMECRTFNVLLFCGTMHLDCWNVANASWMNFVLRKENNCFGLLAIIHIVDLSNQLFSRKIGKKRKLVTVRLIREALKRILGFSWDLVLKKLGFILCVPIHVKVCQRAWYCDYSKSISKRMISWLQLKYFKEDCVKMTEATWTQSHRECRRAGGPKAQERWKSSFLAALCPPERIMF